MKLCLYFSDGFNSLVTAGTEAPRWREPAVGISTVLGGSPDQTTVNYQLSTELSVVQ